MIELDRLARSLHPDSTVDWSQIKKPDVFSGAVTPRKIPAVPKKPNRASPGANLRQPPRCFTATAPASVWLNLARRNAYAPSGITLLHATPLRGGQRKGRRRANGPARAPIEEAPIWNANMPAKAP